ncbi:Hypothetical protein I595_799 [Croceitalea dokdonensis DOKDO 023]|uniref:Outer membrane protein beta-barrel domain-containing protein n=1 Tax=Croceitalea dokdonensis DOKDO 023 TaxID=1300341 RepID=A0A0P7AV03_9FLAO|nr:hypothetical protein [Croceitalea dokdonensis]KPM32383.1 Hypothetical protein I595_799 [Croceitalea dokdonensis DOKDO 023]
MKKISTFIVIALLSLFVQHATAQEEEYQQRVEVLKKQKERITAQEKDALKTEVEKINQRVKRGTLTEAQAKILKEEAAKKRALNIEDRIAIINNRIALLERNEGVIMDLDTLDYLSRIEIGFGSREGSGDRTFGILLKNNENRLPPKYDKRTFSDGVLAFGLNNAIIQGSSLGDSPYKIGGSRFVELGWQWRTRLFKNTNFVRLNYGFSFQFNALKPNDNQFFVENGGQTELQVFPLELDRSKFRRDNLVFPIHFEFGPSRVKETDKTIRYNIDRSFRFGIGGYGGFNMSTRQKLKYQDNGERIKEKIKRDYNTSELIYGLSAYAGFGGTQLYVKYDLNPIFENAAVDQRNISLGLRFDL